MIVLAHILGLVGKRRVGARGAGGTPSEEVSDDWLWASGQTMCWAEGEAIGLA